ncbi:MAG TPA: hypothetical protein VJ741_23655 [Solirubrobacteraceae bacterium]|nr:hypothetical protein [Solirubrobacteraceae bacterium]
MTVRDGIRALGLLGAAAVLVGCGAGVQNGVALQVAPRAQRIDQPFTVVLGGLHSGQAVIVALRSTDASGVPWASSTSLRANPRGQARAGLRLLSSMQPAIKPGDAFYIWRDRPPQRFTVTARASGHTVATTSFTRGGLTPPGVSARMVTPAQAGFAGELFAPAGRARRGAVVVIGGSSGGLPSYQAAALAGAGYPALAVAYFKYPGLPPTLSRIPLEYFARALTWLSRQPGVDPARLLVLGSPAAARPRCSSACITRGSFTG